MVKCINCGKELEKGKTVHKWITGMGQKFILCSSACVKEFIKRYREEMV